MATGRPLTLGTRPLTLDTRPLSLSGDGGGPAPTFTIDGDVRVSRYAPTRIGKSRSTAPKKRIG